MDKLLSRASGGDRVRILMEWDDVTQVECNVKVKSGVNGMIKEVKNGNEILYPGA
jgi:hypothetical protein